MNETTGLKLKLSVMKMVPDMKAVSIFMIVTGVFSCLSLIGLIAGIPLIIAGVKLKDSASAFNSFTAQENPGLLNNGVQNLKEHYRMMKWYFILTVIALLISAVLLLFVLQALIYFLASLAAH